MITFNKPPFVGTELGYIKKAIDNKKISGDGEFTKRCKAWLEEDCQGADVLLTTSCTHALEMAALLLDVLETWESDKALEAHKLTSHYCDFIGSLNEYTSQPATMHRVEPDKINLF